MASCRIILLFWVFIFSGGLHKALAQQFETTVEYNNYIVQIHEDIGYSNMDYISTSVHSRRVKKVERKRQEALETINEAQRKLRKLKPIEQGEEIKAQAIEVVNLYEKVFKQEFKEVNRLKAKSQNSYQAMKTYYEAEERASAMVDSAARQFKDAQVQFAEKVDIKIRTGKDSEKLNEQIDQLSQMNDYVRKLSLSFFRVSKSVEFFMEALKSRPDLSEEKRQEVVEACRESASELRKAGGFKGEKDYQQEMLAAVSFFEKLAQNELKAMSKVAESSRDELTQADVDAYNQAIKTYNKQAPKVVEDVNKAQQKLMKKFTPRRF